MTQTTITTYDKYMYFTWRGISSSKYNCFIVNDKHSLQFVNAPSFSNNYADAMYQNKSYFLGTSVQRKTLTFKVACDRITLDEYREFLSWLNIYSIGFLQLDYEDWYGYNVKLSALTESEKYPLYECEGKMVYMVVLTLTFETTDDFYAVHKYQTTGFITYNNSDNEYQLTDSIFNPNLLTEIETSYENGLEIHSLYIRLNNYGDLDTSFLLGIQNMNGSFTFYQETKALSDESWTISSGYFGFIETNIAPAYSVSVEYNSNSGQCLSNGILAARYQAQNQLVFQTVDMESNILIPAKTSLIIKIDFSMLSSTFPSFAVQFQKRTQVI